MQALCLNLKLLVVMFLVNSGLQLRKAFKGMMDKGVLAGYPCLDVKVTLMDGAFHAVDSSAMAFELAAKGAFRQSMPKAGAQLIEPIMKVDVFTPEDHVGDVIGDLNRRRGMIKSSRGRRNRCSY